jgi:hypothetical protein
MHREATHDALDAALAARWPMRSKVTARTVALLALVACLLTIPRRAEGACVTSPEPPDRNNPHQFVGAFIESLQWGKQGSSRVQPEASLGDLLLQLKLAQEDYRCAVTILSSFAASNDHFIPRIATLARNTFSALIEFDRRLVAETTAALDTPGGLGSAIDRLKSLGAAKTEEWTGLNHIAAASVYVLVKFGENGAPSRRLRITWSERRELVQKLEREFGSGIRTGLRTDAGDTVNGADGAAYLIYRFLTDRKWRAVDE